MSAPPDTVRPGIHALVAEAAADDLRIASDIYDHAARLHSFALIANACRKSGAEPHVSAFAFFGGVPLSILYDNIKIAVAQAIRLGAIDFDAVKLIALARIERRPARLDLAAYPHLPRMVVKTTAAADYAVLLPGLAA